MSTLSSVVHILKKFYYFSNGRKYNVKQRCQILKLTFNSVYVEEQRQYSILRILKYVLFQTPAVHDIIAYTFFSVCFSTLTLATLTTCHHKYCYGMKNYYLGHCNYIKRSSHPGDGYKCIINEILVVKTPALSSSAVLSEIFDTCADKHEYIV